MARSKEFDKAVALDAAVEVFREHGFEGTSTEMLVSGMKIGRQSLYDTFGDKWQLYCAAVERYATSETSEHVRALRTGPSAIDGIHTMMDRVVAQARKACLGVSSICEFGNTKADLAAIQAAAGRQLQAELQQAILRAQVDGDLRADLPAEEATDFLLASISGIRIAARGGADAPHLQSLGRLSLRALA